MIWVIGALIAIGVILFFTFKKKKEVIQEPAVSLKIIVGPIELN